MKIKEMNEDSRPRERLLKFGIENLSDAEVLAIMLRIGARGKKNEINTFSHYSTLKKLFHLPDQMLF